MNSIITEFKKFVKRGNIVDMAVGVIVGSSFTAIVNALSDNILKPLINYLLTVIFGANSISEVYTFLVPVYDAEGAVDLEQSVYIDWGSFINSIINFVLVAVVLFAIVKIVNILRERHKKVIADFLDDVPRKEDFKEMKRLGIRITDDNVEKFMAEKKQRLLEEQQRAKAEAEEQARLDRLANPTTEDLLKQILEEMRKS
jgi:large conductance mechanosensitive channel